MSNDKARYNTRYQAQVYNREFEEFVPQGRSTDVHTDVFKRSSRVLRSPPPNIQNTSSSQGVQETELQSVSGYEIPVHNKTVVELLENPTEAYRPCFQRKLLLDLKIGQF